MPHLLDQQIAAIGLARDVNVIRMHTECDLHASRTTIASWSAWRRGGASAGGRSRCRADGTIGGVATKSRSGRALAENIMCDATRADRFADAPRTGEQI